MLDDTFRSFFIVSSLLVKVAVDREDGCSDSAVMSALRLRTHDAKLGRAHWAGVSGTVLKGQMAHWLLKMRLSNSYSMSLLAINVVTSSMVPSSI